MQKLLSYISSELLLILAISVVVLSQLIPLLYKLKKQGSIGFSNWFKDRTYTTGLSSIIVILILIGQYIQTLPKIIDQFTDDFIDVNDTNNNWRTLKYKNEFELKDEDCDAIIQDGKIVLETKTGDLWQNDKIAKSNVGHIIGRKADFLEEADYFIIGNLVDNFSPNHNWQQAGIAIIQDQQNYVRFTVAADNKCYTQNSCPSDSNEFPIRKKVILQVVSEINGEVDISSKLLHQYNENRCKPYLRIDYPNEFVRLKIAKRGNSYEFAYNYGGREFNSGAFRTKFDEGNQEAKSEMNNPMKPKWIAMIALKGGERIDNDSTLFTHLEKPINADVIKAKFDMFELHSLVN
ncbi:MAG: hypothetical protein GY839_04890 [candidate division Zixibacteria bacterium]|nr:hypothetical protein [candidate division Zixibacteria bacterium]